MKYSEIKRITRPIDRTVPWGGLLVWLSECQSRWDLQLSPSYQRGSIWSLDQKTKYVEHILCGGTSGNCLTWNMRDTDKILELVDGKQRLEAVLGWLRGEVPAFNVHYQDMEGRLYLSGAEFVMSTYHLQTHVEVVGLHLDINSGTPHIEDELLDALREVLGPS